MIEEFESLPVGEAGGLAPAPTAAPSGPLPTIAAPAPTSPRPTRQMSAVEQARALTQAPARVWGAQAAVWGAGEPSGPPAPAPTPDRLPTLASVRPASLPAPAEPVAPAAAEQVTPVATEPAAPAPAPYTGAELDQALAEVTAHRYPRVRCDLTRLADFGPRRPWSFDHPTLVRDGPDTWFPDAVCTDVPEVLERIRGMRASRGPGAFLLDAQARAVVEDVLGSLGKPGLVLAGGSLCRAVLGKSLEGSDLDIFIVGLNEAAAKAAVEKLLATVRARCERSGADIHLYRTRNCLTLVAAGIQIQIILRLYNTMAEVVYGFDFGSSALVYDGKEIWGTALAQAAFVAGVLIWDGSIIRATYERRLKKYMTDMGFMMVLPDLDVVKVAKSPDGLGRRIDMPTLAITKTHDIYESPKMVKLRQRAAEFGNAANLVACDDVDGTAFYGGEEPSVPIEKDCGYADASKVNYDAPSYVDSFNLRQIRRGRASYLVVKPSFDNPWLETVTIPPASLEREILALTNRLAYGRLTITPAILRRVPIELLTELLQKYAEIAKARKQYWWEEARAAAFACASRVVHQSAPDFDAVYPQPLVWMAIKTRADILGLGPVRSSAPADWYGEYIVGYVPPAPEAAAPAAAPGDPGAEAPVTSAGAE